MYGDAAKKENDWAFDYLPKVDREYSWVAYLGRHVRGQGQRPARLRHERRRHRPEFAEEHRRAEESRLAGGLRHLSRRDQRLLEVARHHPGGDEEHQHRGLSPARRGLRGERRNIRQFGALAAMEVGGRAAAGRLPSSIRTSWRAFSSRFASFIKKEGGKFPDPILNPTWNYTDPQTLRSPKWRRRLNGRAAGRCHDDKLEQTIKAGQQLPGFAFAARRRHHLVRQLAVLRLLDRSRGADAAPRHRRSFRPGHLSELGMVLADEPPRPVQSRLLRSQRQAVGSRPRAGLVERSAEEMGGQRCAGFQSRLQPKGSHGPVHHESGRRGPHVRARWPRWPMDRSRNITNPSKARSRTCCIRNSRIIRW